MPVVSLNARLAHDAVASAEVEVALIRITHPDLAEPVLLSTDPTEVITIEPLVFGTWSSWNGEDEAYLFGLVNLTLPDDPDDGPATAALVFDNVDSDLSALLRGVQGQATIDLAVVLASTPDVIEADWTSFKVISAGGDAAAISLGISYEPITAEPWPAGRMTRQRFPALFR